MFTIRLCKINTAVYIQPRVETRVETRGRLAAVRDGKRLPIGRQA